MPAFFLWRLSPAGGPVLGSGGERFLWESGGALFRSCRRRHGNGRRSSKMRGVLPRGGAEHLGDKGHGGGEALDIWEMKGTGEGESMGVGESMGDEKHHGTAKEDLKRRAMRAESSRWMHVCGQMRVTALRWRISQPEGLVRPPPLPFDVA